MLDGGRKARNVQFHVPCFYMWDDERVTAGPIPSTLQDPVETTSEAPAYRDHLIMAVATKQRSGGWDVAVTVYDPDGALVLEFPNLGGGVTFPTKAIADHARRSGRAHLDRSPARTEAGRRRSARVGSLSLGAAARLLGLPRHPGVPDRERRAS